MYHGDNEYTQSKKVALEEMILHGLIKEMPKFNCFLCEYVNQTFTSPGYDPIIVCGKHKRGIIYYAFCTLACPMTGILWDYNGCLKNPNSPFEKLEQADTIIERRKYIETMLCAFQELLGEIQHEEEKDGDKNNNL